MIPDAQNKKYKEKVPGTIECAFSKRPLPYVKTWSEIKSTFAGHDDLGMPSAQAAD